MGAPLSGWPWEKLGSYKYLVYGPFLGQAARLWWKGEALSQNWCFHILAICALRGLLHQLWCSYSNMHFLCSRRRVIQRGLDFNQIDREWDWDNFLILHASVGALACCMLPNLPLWNVGGFATALALHVAFSEPLYYYLHTILHGEPLFSRYHSLHHSSPVPQPFTAEHATLLEHLLIIPVIGVPILGSCFFGYGSVSLIYIHLLGFDFMRCLGHSNAEVLPYQVFEAFPPLRYLIYTPTYHSLHHTDKSSNFCLFMPLFDALGNTINNNSWDLHKKICLNAAEKHGWVPDFVFLAHIVDVSSAMHVQFVCRSLASMPYCTRIILLPLWPLTLIVLLAMWVWAESFTASFYNLRNKLHATWVVPRFGFQYFLPSAARGINKQIEQAILKADILGVKVLSLAALNKNEALNGGGTLFVNKHPNLRVCVVHGNTLTAAVILHEIPKSVKEVFLTGATSKLGRAIALYLSRQKIKVLMLTLSTERFQKIQKEAPTDCQQYLVQVTKYSAAKSCQTWIVGKWITPREQSWAPKGTHFHQFVVPPILNYRRDCTYGDLAAMQLPKDVQGMSVCEYTLDRGMVHACHAGGVVHFLEGWTHHEVGAIDVERIDVVWEAALKHGFKPVWG